MDDFQINDCLRNIMQQVIGEEAATYEIIEREITDDEIEDGKMKVKIEFTAIDSFGDLVAGVEFEDDVEFESDEKIRGVDFSNDRKSSGEADFPDLDYDDIT